VGAVQLDEIEPGHFSPGGGQSELQGNGVDFIYGQLAHFLLRRRGYRLPLCIGHSNALRQMVAMPQLYADPGAGIVHRLDKEAGSAYEAGGAANPSPGIVEDERINRCGGSNDGRYSSPGTLSKVCLGSGIAETEAELHRRHNNPVLERHAANSDGLK